MYTEIKYVLALKREYQAPAEVATIEAHEAAHQGVYFNVTVGGHTYSVKYWGQILQTEFQDWKELVWVYFRGTRIS